MAHASDALLPSVQIAGPSSASAGDFFALLKPRVMSLVVFTALVGMMLAPGHINPVVGFAALLAIAVGATMAAPLAGPLPPAQACAVQAPTAQVAAPVPRALCAQWGTTAPLAPALWLAARNRAAVSATLASMVPGREGSMVTGPWKIY